MKNYLLHFTCLVPGLLIAFAYGRITGDMDTTATVAALLFGMWLGLRLGGSGAKAET